MFGRVHLCYFLIKRFKVFQFAKIYALFVNFVTKYLVLRMNSNFLAELNFLYFYKSHVHPQSIELTIWHI